MKTLFLIMTVLTLIGLASCKKESTQNENTTPVDEQTGACVAIAPATNNVEQCTDGAKKSICESSTVKQLWPNSTVMGVTDDVKPQFVSGRKCNSFAYRTGVK